MYDLATKNTFIKKIVQMEDNRLRTIQNIQSVAINL